MSLVGPPLTVTASGEHAGFPGTLSIGTAVLTDVLVELARSADWAAGLVLVNGHGGNATPSTPPSRTLAAEGRAVLAWWPAVAGGDAHAGRTETSLMLALDPPAVRLERAARRRRRAPIGELAAGCGRGGVRAVSANGVLGDPAGATRRARPRAAGGARSTTCRRRRRVAPRATGATAVTRYVLDRVDPSARRRTRRHRRLAAAAVPPHRRRRRGTSTASPPASDVPVVAARRPAARRRRRPPGARRPARSRRADVTVVVPALAADADAPRSVAGRPAPASPRVVVVDDGSQPPIAAGRGHPPAAAAHATAGRRVARNAGLAAVTTPLVAFVDTDVDLAPGWLDPLLGHFADERVGLVAPRVAAATGGPARSARLRGDPLAPRPRPRAGRVAPGTRVSYVPAAALVARTAAMREIDGFDRRPARRRGRRPRLAAGRGGVAVPLRAGGGRPPRAAADVAAPRRPARRLRLVGGPARPAPSRCARAGPDQRVERRRVGAAAGRRSRSARPPSPPAPRSRSVPQAARACRPPSRSRWPRRGHLLAGRQLADAARRVWWPALLLGSLVSRRVRRVAALAALCRPWSTAGRCGCSTTPPTASACGRACSRRAIAPLVPDLRSWPGGSDRKPRRRPAHRVVRMTVRLTVDEERWRDHVARGRPPQPGADPRREGQRLRVRPRRPGPHRRRARRRHRGRHVHELAGLPGGATRSC